jgi:hypothetical protein
MTARGICKTAVVLVTGMMMISPALVAAPNGHSNPCSSTDGLLWGGGGNGPEGLVWGGGNGPNSISSVPTGPSNKSCSGAQVRLHTDQTRSEHGHGFASGFGEVLAGLRGYIGNAILGGNGSLGTSK